IAVVNYYHVQTLHIVNNFFSVGTFYSLMVLLMMFRIESLYGDLKMSSKIIDTV
ncbi:unnamed protein product, partial [Arabidopsis halleri]